MWEHADHGFFPFFPFCFLFLLLVIGFIIFAVRSYRWRHSKGGNVDQIIKAENILKQRLASGEITEEQYQRLKEVISK